MWSKIILDTYGDNRGHLLPVEFQDLQFFPRRLYTIFGNQNGVDRGKHAHKSLQQLIICVTGSFVLHLDDGQSVEQILMNKPGKAVYLDGVVWRELRDLSTNCVINVLASEPFDENDYIRSYEDFLELI